MTKNTRYFNSSLLKVDHYENFPVGSFLIPTQLRIPVRQIYQFARTADDIADEGNASNSKRLEALLIYENNFRDYLEKNKKENHIFLALSKTIEKHNLLKHYFPICYMLSSKMSHKKGMKLLTTYFITVNALQIRSAD